jgi:ferredoxin
MKSTIAVKLANKFFADMALREVEMAELPGAVRPTKDSPIRFEIIQEKLKLGGDTKTLKTIPVLAKLILGVNRSVKSIKDNPERPKNNIQDGLLYELEAYLFKLGASSIGYTKLPAQWVFQQKGALHDHVIVLTMKMDREWINKAPHPEAEYIVLSTYRDLGEIANRAAVFLRKNGFSAQVGHPLNGQTLYPPLAQLAGLGQLVHSGLIITPENGACVRLAAIYTSIENLPFSTGNEHTWIKDFCSSCGLCVRKCPSGAIYEKPVQHENGRITHIDSEKCFPYFHFNHGCSVCIKVCPFNQYNYDKIKKRFMDKKERQQTQ